MWEILEFDSLLALSGNASITAASAMVLFYVGRRLYRNARIADGAFGRMSKESVLFAAGLFAWSLGEVIRIGWWVPAIFMAPAGTQFHPWFTAHKGEMMIVATLLIVFGVALATRELKGRNWRWMAVFSLVAFFVGWLVGLAWWLR